MTTNTRLAHTTSTHEVNMLKVARVAAAGRVAEERIAREKRENAAFEAYLIESSKVFAEGGSLDENGEVTYCYICSRATDHLGEHTPEQIAAWQASNQYAWITGRRA